MIAKLLLIPLALLIAAAIAWVVIRACDAIDRSVYK